MALACSALTYIHANKQECIEHSLISGLTTGDGHTQYALLTGRSGTNNNLLISTTQNGRVIGSSAANFDLSLFGSSHAEGGRVLINNGTVATSVASFASLRIPTLFTGDGEGPQGFINQPTFVPSASITIAYGYLSVPVFNPDTSVTITQAVAGFSRVDTGNNAGAVTAAYGNLVNTPALGTLKPATIYGNYLANQGSTGVTNAVGLLIEAQTGASNNFDMGFGSVDTTAAGTYYGRVPVLYNGLLKYIHVFDA